MLSLKLSRRWHMSRMWRMARAVISSIAKQQTTPTTRLYLTVNFRNYSNNCGRGLGCPPIIPQRMRLAMFYYLHPMLLISYVMAVIYEPQGTSAQYYYALAIQLGIALPSSRQHSWWLSRSKSVRTKNCSAATSYYYGPTLRWPLFTSYMGEGGGGGGG